MDNLISYLLEKGGGWGVLLVLSILWIVYRENFYYQSSKNTQTAQTSQATQGVDQKEHLEKIKADIDKMVFILEDIKGKKDEWATKSELDKIINYIGKLEQIQDDSFDKINEITPILNQIYSLDKEVERKTQELWAWHAVFDTDGVPVWYVRKSLTESIDNLDLTINLLQDKCMQANDVLKNDLMIRLQKVNDERIVELKSLLEVYNKTVTDLVVTLEKLKNIIKSESGD